MSSDIYLFLSDEAFASVPTATVVKYADISRAGVGMLDDNLLNYFVDHSLFLDPIQINSESWRKSRTHVDEDLNPFESTPATPVTDPPFYEPDGRMMLHFDAAKLLDDSSTTTFNRDLMVGFVVNQNDIAEVATTKRNRLRSLFNIVDTIFNARNRDGNPKDAQTIDGILENTLEDETTYSGYVGGSLVLSSSRSESTIKLKTSSSTNISRKRWYWDSCSFKYSFSDSNATGGTTTITFHIWLNSEQFKENYPYSTIVDCLYPCSAEWIMNPSLYANQTRAILTSSNYKNDMISRAVTARDHSGVTLISSRYIAEYSDEMPMSFALLYKGARPSPAAAREYLRLRLLEETDRDGNTWTSEQWRCRLPDLFVDGSYYLVPIYSQRIILPATTSAIERSCIDYKKIFSIVRTVLGCMNLDDATLMSNIDLLQAPGHSLYIIGIATDPLQNPVPIPLHDLHLTYSAVDAVSSSFDSMSPGDQDFAEKIARCLAICLNLDHDEQGLYTDSTIGTRSAKSFAAGDIYNNTNMEYIMLVYDKDDPIWS